MGKVFRNDKSKLTTVFVLSVIFLIALNTYASDREIDLFDRAYEDYLSYRPEKAADEYRSFLRKFPDSSAGDVVLFWLGKSLMQLKSFEEAKKAFLDLKQKFPESPFVIYAEREIDTIKKMEPVEAKIVAPASNPPEAKISVKTDSGKEKEIQPSAEVPRTAEDKEKQKSMLEEEKETELLSVMPKESEDKMTYMTNSSYVLNALGVKEVIWRSGNMDEDFVDEQLLYEKARELNILPDTNHYAESVNGYGFSKEQADYLDRYLTICNFIKARLKDVPEERVVESLIVKYEEGDKNKKIVLTKELQERAKSGMSFEEIHGLYPDVVKFAIFKIDELQGWIQKKIRFLQNGEVGVIWSEEGYMILKPLSEEADLNPCEEMHPQAWKMVKSYVSDLINELRGKKDVIETDKIR